MMSFGTVMPYTVYLEVARRSEHEANTLSALCTSSAKKLQCITHAKSCDVLAQLRG